MRALAPVLLVLGAALPAGVIACLDPLCLLPTAQNPGFEECADCAPDAGAMPDGWAMAWGEGRPEWTLGDSFTGAASLRIPCTSGDFWETTAVRSALIPVRRGHLDAFHVTAMARAEGAPVDALAGIAWYAEDGTNFGVAAAGARVDSTWFQVGTMGSSQSTEAGGAWIALLLACLDSAGDGTALFDDVQVLYVH